MNREILFRGFNEDPNGNEEIEIDGKAIKGKWVEGFYWNNGVNNHFIKQLYSDDEYKKITLLSYEVIPETVSQYTGLDDKNERKIFENDIIRLDNSYRKMISSCNAKSEEELVRKDCLVGFKDGSFMFCRNKYTIDAFDSYLWISHAYCEVIGTIFGKKEVSDEENM